MSQEEVQQQDRLLQDALKHQRQLVDFYKQAAKDAPEDQCKDLFKRLRKALEDQVGDVAGELARHRKQRNLGRPIEE
ncbi:MAG: hypothetical protein M3Q29_01650 [Chloroflexota bacterium]|nr:hypothetical protein [Chloroflexota bacterium]